MMFGLLKKKEKAVPQDPVERILQARAQRIDISRQVIPQNLDQKMFELGVRNCAIAVNGLLTRSALLHRARNNAAAALAELRSGSDFLDHAIRAIEAAALCGLQVDAGVLGSTDIARAEANGKATGNEVFVYVANLRDLLCLALLAGEWQRAERLAIAASSPVVIDGTACGEPPFARLILALVLGDEKAFSVHRRELDVAWKSPEAGDSYFLNTYSRHDLLMEPILSRDAVAFDSILKDRERLFLARGSDKRLEKGEVLDGVGMPENSRVFDVWSTALARLARHRGLEVTYSSAIVPTEDFR